MRHHPRLGWGPRRAAGLSAALLIVLMGCNAGQPRSDTPHSGQGAPRSTTDGGVPTATGSVQCQAHALPQGWTWYRDARYPFRVAIPPTWRTGAFEYIPDGSGVDASPSHVHVVDLFGPGSGGQAASSGKNRYDTFAPVIQIDLGAGEQAPLLIDGFTQNLAFHAQPTPVCVGDTPVTVYVFANDEGDVERAALLPAGPQGYPCAFVVASHAETAVRDAELFLTVLNTFDAPLGA
jgi:hypothetical protein